MSENNSISGLPEPSDFYRPVAGEDHLHFGCWPEDAPDLPLEEAQERMFQLLLGHFPEPPATVLGVGCELGLTAIRLAQKGYRVTALAVCEASIDNAVRHFAGSGIDFQAADFLEGESFASKTYDVILFDESLQYLRPLDAVFRKARSLLDPKGAIIIGDPVCLNPDIEKETSVHPLNEIVCRLFENGFRITVNDAIGSNVARTCDRIIDRLTREFEGTVASIPGENIREKSGFFLNGWKSRKKWYEKQDLGYQVLVAKQDPLFLRTYREGDEHCILPMFNRVFQQNRSLEHWSWKFKRNPFGACRIVLAFTQDGTFAAQYCGYPIPFRFDKGAPEDFFAFHIGDTMTNPDCRQMGLGTTSALTRATTYFYHKFCLGAVAFNYGYNTGNIRKYGERFLGYEYTSPVPYHVLDLDKRSPKPVSKIKRWISGLSVEEVKEVSAEYDRFFDDVAKDYGLLVKRGSAYLKWRYLDCPDRVHRFFAVRRRRKLVGWGVFAIRGNALMWGDALFAKAHADTIALLLDHALKGLHANLIRIEGWFSPAPGWWSEALKTAGFQTTREPNDLAPGFRIFDRTVSTEILQKYNYYTMGDGDLF